MNKFFLKTPKIFDELLSLRILQFGGKNLFLIFPGEPNIDLFLPPILGKGFIQFV
jgi:hypothetical protein